MISETKTEPAETISTRLSGRLSEMKKDLAPSWSEFWEGALQAASATASISALKAGRIAILGVLGVVLSGVLLALGVYGFVLLNAAFDYALSQPDYPPWVSPVVRGAIYFGVCAIPLAIVLFSVRPVSDEVETDSELSRKERERGA